MSLLPSLCVAVAMFTIIALLGLGAQGSLLIKAKGNLMKANGNASTYDITHVFDYPVSVNGGYSYTWDPRGKAPVPGTGNKGEPCFNDTAVCQAADFPRVCGLAHSALWFADFNGGQNFTIMYPHYSDTGDEIINGIRTSYVHFIPDDHSEKEAEIEMNGEGPYTEYTFTVRGRCIGQPKWGDDQCPTCRTCPKTPGGMFDTETCCPKKPVVWREPALPRDN